MSPFQQFTYNPEKAKQILESDGYDCSEVPCTKGGAKLVVDYSTVPTNEVRVQIQKILKERARPAGFDIQIKNFDRDSPLGVRADLGRFAIAHYSIPVGPDPSITWALACENIPRKGGSGSNWNRWCDRRATDLMHRSDQEPDPERRLQLMDQIYSIEAHDSLSLPLYVLPFMAAWRTDRIAGPIGDFTGSPYGLFFNMNEWYKVRR
jgi:ABC-type transport system substrate-binding protein